MAITDAATLRHMTAYAFLNPFKDIASLLVPDEEDTHLRNKVNQQLPAHLSNPMLRVLLTGLTYIALAATFFGIFLLREAASTDVSDFSGTLKGENEKEVARKQARLESALAKLGTHNTPPASSDEDSAMDNDMPPLPITTPIEKPVPEKRKRVFRHHTRAKSRGFPITEEWRRPKDENLDSDKGIDTIFNRAIKIPLPLPLKESVKDSSWALPPTTCSESDNSSKSISSSVTTTDDDSDDSDDNDMPSLNIVSDEDLSWASAPPSPINNQAAAICSSVHLSDIPHSSNGNHEFIGKKEELSL